MAQMRSIGWGTGPEGELAEFLQLARCENVAEKSGQGAAELFKAKKEQSETAVREINLCRQQLTRVKEELDLLHDRLRRTKKQIRKTDPVLRTFPTKVRVNGELVPTGVTTACPGFIDDGRQVKSPRKAQFELNDEEVVLSSDDDEPEERGVAAWVNEKVSSMILYGREVDYRVEDSDTDDDEELQRLDHMLLACREYAQGQPGYNAEEARRAEALKQMERQKLALHRLVLGREGQFNACKARLDAAQEDYGRLRMENHYVCRMNQIRSFLHANQREVPDLLGKQGPCVFDAKLSKEEELHGWHSTDSAPRQDAQQPRSSQ